MQTPSVSFVQGDMDIATRDAQLSQRLSDHLSGSGRTDLRVGSDAGTSLTQRVEGIVTDRGQTPLRTITIPG